MDSAAGKLYYVPRAGQDPNKSDCQLPLLETLVDASGMSNVSYDGIAFELSTWMGQVSKQINLLTQNVLENTDGVLPDPIP